MNEYIVFMHPDCIISSKVEKDGSTWDGFVGEMYKNVENKDRPKINGLTMGNNGFYLKTEAHNANEAIDIMKEKMKEV